MKLVKKITKNLLLICILSFFIIACKNENLYNADKSHEEKNSETSLNVGEYYIVIPNVLNIRKKPNAESEIIERVTSGEVLYVTDYNYNYEYAEIVYDGKKCYVSNAYIKKQTNIETSENTETTETKTTETIEKIPVYNINCEVLNIMEKPLEDSEILARKTIYDEIYVLNLNKGEWSEVLYENKICYVKTKYIGDKVREENIKNITNDYENIIKYILNNKGQNEQNEINNKYIEITESEASKKYPIMDGSTANIPLMAQIRSDYLNEDLMTSQNNTEVSTTDYAWRNILDGNADILLVYEGSEPTKKLIEDSDVKLRITPIGVDALVFIENENNLVNNLTLEQIQKIYTGEITNWNELGGEDLPIVAFQRPINSGSQTLFLNLVMKDIKPIATGDFLTPAEMDGLIDRIASYNNTKNAIGYSVYYYAKKMYQGPGLKLISVDNIMPSDETIANKTYPFLNEFYVVVREEDLNTNNEIKKLYDYIISDKGKEALVKSGYIPVNN